MNRTTVLLMVAMLVAAGVPATAAFAQESSGEQPGATFAGVVGVQGAEVEGEVAQRSLDRRLAGAESNASKASVVAGETEDVRQQLSELRERRETLDRRYESGEITRGEYRSKLARIGAQIRTLERRLNTTAAVAEGIPEETLRERGVNASAIAELRRNASEMGGGEVAEAARGIGGADTGKGLAGDPGPPEDAGPPGDTGPPEDAGPPGNDDTGPPGNDDLSEGNGPPGDRTNATGSDGDGEADNQGRAHARNDSTDRGAAGTSGPPGDEATGAGDARGNATDDANGETDEPGSGASDRGDDAPGNSDGTDGDRGSDAGSDDARGNSDDTRGNSDDARGNSDDARGNAGGTSDDQSDDGTVAPTEIAEDDSDDRHVDDGRYLTPR
ncbi:hypothetical protein [Halobaculum rarum]|uniref:hypothetical protein n=1 Tax=Halobaculum rarum TaxID=3075122 RepID=UPI0032AF7E79